MINFLRAVVRPYIALSGWTTFLLVASTLILRFADQDVAMMFGVAFMEAVSIFIGYYFGQRSITK